MKTKWRKLKNYSGILAILILCGTLAAVSFFLYSPRVNLGKYPVLSSTKLMLYNCGSNSAHLLVLMPDKFVFPSDIGFFSSEPFALPRIIREPNIKDSYTVLYKTYNVFHHKDEMLWPETKIPLPRCKDDFLRNDIFERKRISFRGIHGILIILSEELKENDFMIPDMPVGLFPTNVLSCRINAFVRIKNGCVSDVFIEESDAPFEVNSRVLQKIYRATARNVQKEIYGNIIVAWKK